MCVDSDSFVGAEYRLDVISAILIENEFEKWSDLKFAEDPAKWGEAGRLSNSELDFLRKVIDVGRQVPQYALVCIVVCSV